jgi:hypothetical protein
VDAERALKARFPKADVWCSYFAQRPGAKVWFCQVFPRSGGERIICAARVRGRWIYEPFIPRGDSCLQRQTRRKPNLGRWHRGITFKCEDVDARRNVIGPAVEGDWKQPDLKKVFIRDHGWMTIADARLLAIRLGIDFDADC